MNTTRDRLKNRKRAVHVVQLDGADPLYVRELTIADLREIDSRSETAPTGPERLVRSLELGAMFALTEADGAPTFPGRTDEDLDTVAHLTPVELRALQEVYLPSKDDAKKG